MNLPTYLLNGTIVAECDFEVEKIRKGWGCLNGTRYFRISEKHYYPDFELEKHSCLSFDEVNNYLKGKLNQGQNYCAKIKIKSSEDCFGKDENGNDTGILVTIDNKDYIIPIYQGEYTYVYSP